jgi:hypothetical protein
MERNLSASSYSSILVWLAGFLLSPIDCTYFICILTARLLCGLRDSGHKIQLVIASLLMLVWPAVAFFDEVVPGWIVSVTFVVIWGAWLMWETREHKVKAMLKLALILVVLLAWAYYLGWKANQ